MFAEFYRIKLLEEQLETEKTKNAELKAGFEHIKSELEHARALYESEKAARENENECVRGEYCAYCKYSVMVPRYAGSDVRSKCVCTYGTCKHFEKEAEHEPDY